MEREYPQRGVCEDSILLQSKDVNARLQAQIHIHHTRIGTKEGTPLKDGTVLPPPRKTTQFKSAGKLETYIVAVIRLYSWEQRTTEITIGKNVSSPVNFTAVMVKEQFVTSCRGVPVKTPVGGSSSKPGGNGGSTR